MALRFRSLFGALASWVAVLLPVAALAQGSTTPARRPNILVILTDDQRWDALFGDGEEDPDKPDDRDVRSRLPPLRLPNHSTEWR